MARRRPALHCAASVLAGVLAGALACTPAPAAALTGFGPLSGSGGCLVAPGQASSETGTSGCANGNALLGARAVAVSPDGANVYVAGGVAGDSVAKSFGGVAIFKRDPATGALSETGCLSSDGTDGRDGASGACTPTPSLLGADGVAVSPDGSTVFVTSSSSASVIAFAREAATGALTRLGCLQGTPRIGSPCGAADLFPSSSAPVVSADGSSLYVAAPLEGSVSTLNAAARVASERAAASKASGSGAAGATGTTATGTTTASGASGSTTAATTYTTLASIFTALPDETFLSNPCTAVNGLDGVCAIGIATQGLDDLALSPDGKQLYAAAPGSRAIDVFAPSASGGLSQTGCVKVEAPPGLCSAAKLMFQPTSLAVSPDGRNVYAADSGETGNGSGAGIVDVLSREPASGALTNSGCVDNLAKPVVRDKEEQEEEQEEGQEEEEKAPAPPPDPCASAPGVEGVSVVAVSGDGSSVYAIGDGGAAIFARDPATGALRETSCAVADDSRCTSLPTLQGVSGAAISTDGREVYVVASKSSAIRVFSVGAAVTSARASATRAGAASVEVACPGGLRRACSGHVSLVRTLATAARHGHRRRVRRITAGSSSDFSIGPGRHARVSVRLTPAERRLLARRHRVRLIAVVRAAPSGGGSGFGRHLTLRIAGR